MLKRGMEQEDLLGFPHPEVAAGQGEPPLPRLCVLDVPVQFLTYGRKMQVKLIGGGSQKKNFEFLSFSVSCDCTFLA